MTHRPHNEQNGIDYEQLAKAIVTAEQDAAKEKEANKVGFTLGCLAVAAIAAMIGVWSGLWWAGVLSFIGLVLIGVDETGSKILSIPVAGLVVYLIWAWIVPGLWYGFNDTPAAPVWVKLVCSLFGGFLAFGGFRSLPSER